MRTKRIRQDSLHLVDQGLYRWVEWFGGRLHVRSGLFGRVGVLHLNIDRLVCAIG
jgi:hypothetical protein